MPENKHFPVFGEDIEIEVSSASTGNTFCMFIQTCPPMGGPPPHIHSNEDEVFIPISGEFELWDGERWTALPVGQAGYATRNTLHTFRNAASEPGRLRIICTPGRLDEYLETISPLRMPDDMQKLFGISDEYGIYFSTLGHPKPVAK